jgi:4-diphosphocytidyl-2-C-methyl-D-erythritol kinase
VDQQSSPTSRLAPAKINLALHITGRRDDGYHLLESLVVFTRFGDRVSIEPGEADELIATGPFADRVPTDDGNLAIKARDRLRGFLQRSRSTFPVRIHLEKNLPVASGVGGGSSDAAAALTALAALWYPAVARNHLHDIGLSLGADVPMCLVAQPLVARGIGDDLSPVANVPALPLVLVNTGAAVSTAAVFAALASRNNPPLPPLPSRFDFHSLRNWLETTRNDLEPPALAMEPSVGAALAALKKAGAGFARMSGSGATCFGLFETNNVAKRAAADIRKRHPDWFVAATRSIASEE